MAECQGPTHVEGEGQLSRRLPTKVGGGREPFEWLSQMPRTARGGEGRRSRSHSAAGAGHAGLSDVSTTSASISRMQWSMTAKTWKRCRS